jgi:orotidine-5'-phosphate decarboxylase|uniref:Orotidine 5'-phosphate decarboxylase n=1 Tax=candidate division WOR-3 bacterium TaxID=2052148 RepID=A0A7C3UPK2_UNCW3
MAPKLVLALDLETINQVKKILAKVTGWIDYYKIGYKLYFRSGPRVVRFFKSKGERVFLDLKLFDIPSVVESASLYFTKLGVDIFNLHTLGGLEMMQRARAVCQNPKTRPLLLGVTILTTMDEKIFQETLGIKGHLRLRDAVLYLSLQAKKAGLDGVVSSPFEIEEIKRECGKDFLVLCPGIRIPTAGVVKDDQKRFLTPREAKERGADFLVIGRPILQSPDPVEVIEMIKKEIED